MTEQKQYRVYVVYLLPALKEDCEDAQQLVESLILWEADLQTVQ